MDALQTVSTRRHPNNVQAEGQLGVRGPKIHPQPTLQYKKLPNSCGY